MAPFALFWVWVCACLNCAGWGLSAIHELNAGGYAAVLLAGLAGWLVWRVKAGWRTPIRLRWAVLRRRFRRPFPLAFLILTALAFLGGVIHAPSNYDGLTYRLPRVLHWLAAGQWHWIHTIFPRVNARACGIEWVSAPLMALTRTDRLLFLINVVSFLLLPGLVYSVFTRLGVRRRVAWHWMWVAPTGYCYLVQAGSVANDLFGAPFVLAAVDFALRARRSQAPRDFFASVIAAALMTSAKTSDLPLLLPWGLAILPSWRLGFRRPLGLAAVVLIAVGASFLPTALLNRHYCDDWTGLKSEGACVKSDPLLRTGDNVLLLTLQNLAPPVFPWAGAWNQKVQKLVPAGLSLRLHETFVEPEAAEFKLEDMQIEENAGLGLGVSMLLLLSVAAAIRRGGRRVFGWPFHSREELWLASLRWSPLVSLLALLSQSSVYPLARILTPFYALLLPVWLAGPAQEPVVRRGWWRAAAAAVFLMGGMLVIISPERPLFPATRIFSALVARHPHSALWERTLTVYETYHDRPEAFAPVLARLPPDVKILGLFTYDDPETSLWLPLGSRRIEHVCPDDTAGDMSRRGIRYVLIPPDKLKQFFQVNPDDWVRRLNATVVWKISLRLRIADGATEWWLVKLP